MRKVIVGGSLLLLVQLGLLVFSHTSTTSRQESSPGALLASFAGDAVDTIEIAGSDGRRALLHKESSGWVLPNLHGSPADEAQVKSLLSKVGDARKGLAVATSSGAARRFKTADDNYTRHLRILAGEEVVVDLYLGTTASVHQTHGRLAGEQAVYALGLNSYEVEPEDSQWLAGNLLQVAEDALREVRINDLHLVRSEGEGWQLVAPAGAATEQQLLNELVTRVNGLTAENVEPAAEVGLDGRQPDLRIQLAAEVAELRYVVYTRKDGSALIRRNDDSLLYHVPAWQVTALQEVVERVLRATEARKGIKPVADDTPPVG